MGKHINSVPAGSVALQDNVLNCESISGHVHTYPGQVMYFMYNVFSGHYPEEHKANQTF